MSQVKCVRQIIECRAAASQVKIAPPPMEIGNINRLQLWTLFIVHSFSNVFPEKGNDVVYLF